MTALQGERVLVTGAAGFIGSHLVEQLVQRGARVRALLRYNSRAAIGALDDVDPTVRGELEVLYGDVRDGETVARAVQGVSVVFHLAAQIAIPYSYFAPRDVFETNVLGTLNVLEGVRRHGSRRVIHTSTSEVFGTAQYVPMDERHPMHGQSPYSASKIAADRLVESFVRTYSTPAVVVRPFNTFGPRQSDRAIVPTIALQLLDGTGQLRLGALTPTRDLTYVEDTVRGLILAAEADGIEGAEINLGSGTEITIGDLAGLVARAMGVTLPEIVCEPVRLRPERSEVLRLCADNTRARQLLGWTPKVSLLDGLARTVEWLRHHRDWYRCAGFRL